MGGPYFLHFPNIGVKTKLHNKKFVWAGAVVCKPILVKCFWTKTLTLDLCFVPGPSLSIYTVYCTNGLLPSQLPEFINKLSRKLMAENCSRKI